jgi:hypothetical protein
VATPRPPAPVAAHGSYLPSYAVITEGKKREMPALQSVDYVRRDASLYLEKEVASVSVFDVTVARLRKP